MSGFFPFASSGSTVVAASNDTFEPLGYGTDGSLSILTAGTANTKGSYTSSLTTTSAWCGFWLDFGVASTSTARFLIDISLDGGTSIAISNLYVCPSNSMNHRFYVPLAVGSGATIALRCQSSTSTATVKFAINGRKATVNTPTGYSTCTELVSADTANTRPPTTSIALQSSLSTWTQLLASTSAQYGALLYTIGDNATPTTTQQGMALLATGASGSEAEIARTSCFILTSAGNVPKMNRLVERVIPSGSRISAAGIAPTPGTDALRMCLHGFS